MTKPIDREKLIDYISGAMGLIRQIGGNDNEKMWRIYELGLLENAIESGELDAGEGGE